MDWFRCVDREEIKFELADNSSRSKRLCKQFRKTVSQVLDNGDAFPRFLNEAKLQREKKKKEGESVGRNYNLKKNFRGKRSAEFVCAIKDLYVSIISELFFRNRYPSSNSLIDARRKRRQRVRERGGGSGGGDV